ncbi:MAG: hypothetical protein R2941_15925 [Desulfobacterales bacterium]
MFRKPRFFSQRENLCQEQHPERIAQIRENRKRFGAYQMEVVQGQAPDGLEDFAPGLTGVHRRR